MAKGWSLDPSEFAGMVEQDVGKKLRVISVQLLNEIVMTSPVGNPELWAINSGQVRRRQRVDDINAALRASDAFGYADKNGNRRIKPGNKLQLSKAVYSSNSGKFGPQRIRKLERGQGEIYSPPGYVGGTFRASHLVSVDSPDYSEPDGPDKDGTRTIEQGSAVIAGSPAFSVIYIQSNLPYSVALENGHSTQAPTGIYANAFNGVAQANK